MSCLVDERRDRSQTENTQGNARLRRGRDASDDFIPPSERSNRKRQARFFQRSFIARAVMMPLKSFQPTWLPLTGLPFGVFTLALHRFSTESNDAIANGKQAEFPLGWLTPTQRVRGLRMAEMAGRKQSTDQTLPWRRASAAEPQSAAAAWWPSPAARKASAPRAGSRPARKRTTCHSNNLQKCGGAASLRLGGSGFEGHLQNLTPFSLGFSPALPLLRPA